MVDLPHSVVDGTDPMDCGVNRNNSDSAMKYRIRAGSPAWRHKRFDASIQDEGWKYFSTERDVIYSQKELLENDLARRCKSFRLPKKADPWCIVAFGNTSIDEI